MNASRTLHSVRMLQLGNNMYANMTEELLDPKPENQETLRQNELLKLMSTWQVQRLMRL